MVRGYFKREGAAVFCWQPHQCFLQSAQPDPRDEEFGQIVSGHSRGAKSRLHPPTTLLEPRRDCQLTPTLPEVRLLTLRRIRIVGTLARVALDKPRVAVASRLCWG